MAKRIKKKSNQSEEATTVSEVKESTDEKSNVDTGEKTKRGGEDETDTKKQKKGGLFGLSLDHFELKIDAEDKWEFWSIGAVVLFVIALILLVISLLQLGKWSLYAWMEGLLYCGFATIVIGFLGMLRVLFRPPPIRRTRTIAFVLLLLVGVVGLMQPRPFAIPLSTDDWKSDVPIHLPFNGTWTTIQGNDDNNYLKQMKMPPMMWSYVFTAQEGKRIHRATENALKLEDYYCWDKPVLAPVSGEVVDFSNSMPDLLMGESAQQYQTSPLGNFVAIKFGEKEFIYIVGLKSKSVTVKPGDKVTAGQEIGRCGRSGYTPFPAVAMHGQNSLTFPYSEGLPIEFSDITIDGTFEKVGRPKGTQFDPKLNVSEGDLVSNGAQ